MKTKSFKLSIAIAFGLAVTSTQCFALKKWCPDTGGKCWIMAGHCSGPVFMWSCTNLSARPKIDRQADGTAYLIIGRERVQIATDAMIAAFKSGSLSESKLKGILARDKGRVSEGIIKQIERELRQTSSTTKPSS